MSQGVAAFPIFGNLPRLVNIPKSRVYGIDAEISARPFDGLRLSAGLTYVNSGALANPSNPVDALGASKSFVGQSFPSTPRWQAVGDAEYRFPLGGEKMAFLGGSVVARSSTYAAFGENADFKIKGYALLDLRAGI